MAWHQGQAATATPESGDALSRDVALISVMDAHVMTLPDDGCGIGGHPNGGRRRIEAMLMKRAEVLDEAGAVHRVPLFRFQAQPGPYRFDSGARGAAEAARIGHERDYAAPYSDGADPAVAREEWLALRKVQCHRKAIAEAAFAEAVKASRAASVGAAISELVEHATARVTEDAAKAKRGKP